MVFKTFRIVCAVRVAAIAAALVLLSWGLFRSWPAAILFFLGAVTVSQVYGLVRYVDRTNRELARFFLSVKYEDFTRSFEAVKLGGSFAPLVRALNEVIEVFRRTRAEKEEHFQFLQTIVQHVAVGLIAFRGDGTVSLLNSAAKRLLRVSSLNNIKALEPQSPELVRTMAGLDPGRRAVVRIENEEERLDLVLFATDVRLRGMSLRLVSLQNIRSEIEQTEIEAWQKLIRVLTHEIMNSVAPISSLAATVNELLSPAPAPAEGSARPDSETLADVRQALDTIHRRSDGLLHFVDAYRNLTLLPKPKFQIFRLQEAFGRAAKLMEAHIRESGIVFNWRVEPESLNVKADPELLEQVLINLLLNARQAVEGRPGAHISLSGRLDALGRVLIQVADNGPGIPAENLEKIFIPFFSTKETGSGIGLSLARQIMRLHDGAITAHSKPGEETVFTLRF